MFVFVRACVHALCLEVFLCMFVYKYVCCIMEVMFACMFHIRYCDPVAYETECFGLVFISQNLRVKYLHKGAEISHYWRLQ